MAAVTAPLDTLGAPWSDDVPLAARAAVGGRRHCGGRRAGARGGRWADTAFPDQNPHAIRCLDLRELDIGPCWKRRMRRQRRTESIESIGVRQRTENHALRVSDREDRGG